VLSLLWLASEAFGAPSASVLTDAWTGAQPLMKSRGTLAPFVFEPGEMAQLAAGAIVKHKGKGKDGGEIVQALVWIPMSVERVWLSIQDDEHNKLAEGLREEVLRRGTDGSKTLYQFLDLPYPFDDRHWVIGIKNNALLFEASDGVLWERTWYLDPAGENTVPPRLAEAAPGAVYTPVNRGGWSLVQVENGTLLLYQVETDVGGYVPDRFVARFTYSGIEDLFARVEKGAQEVPFHYKQGHAVFVRPDSSAIEIWPRKRP
jgi:hypothetical protein